MTLLTKSSLGSFLNIEKPDIAKPPYINLLGLASNDAVANGQTNQNDSFGATASIVSSGYRLVLDRNIWIRYTLPSAVTVTATNTFTWQIEVNDVGEIHGLCLFRNNLNEATGATVISQVIYQAGPQTTPNYLDKTSFLYTGPGFQTFTLLLSNLYPIGSVIDRIMFINDVDAAPYEAESQFRNFYFTP